MGNVIEREMPRTAPTNSMRLPSIGMVRANMMVSKEQEMRKTYSQTLVDLKTVGFIDVKITIISESIRGKILQI